MVTKALLRPHHLPSGARPSRGLRICPELGRILNPNDRNRNSPLRTGGVGSSGGSRPSSRLTSAGEGNPPAPPHLQENTVGTAGSRPGHSASRGPALARPSSQFPAPAPNSPPRPRPAPGTSQKKTPKAGVRGRGGAAQSCPPLRGQASGVLVRAGGCSLPQVGSTKALGDRPPPSRLSRSARARRPEGGGLHFPACPAAERRCSRVRAAARRRGRSPEAARRRSAGRGARAVPRGAPGRRRRQSEWSAPEPRAAAA